MKKRLLSKLSSQQKKAVYVLTENVERFVEQNGKEHCAVLTLTFKDPVTDPGEASKRLNSFMSNFLRDRIDSHIAVKELHESGAWHYHLLVSFQAPICRGFRWKCAPGSKAIPVFKTATKALKTLWREIREAAPKYGLGRCELLPCRTGKGLGRYFSKAILQRAADPERFRSIRLISYSRNILRSVANFAWHNEFTQNYRRKVKRFATELCGITEAFTGEPPDIDWLSYLLPSWFWRFSRIIDDVDRILAQSDLATLYRLQIQPTEF